MGEAKQRKPFWQQQSFFFFEAKSQILVPFLGQFNNFWLHVLWQSRSNKITYLMQFSLFKCNERSYLLKNISTIIKTWFQKFSNSIYFAKFLKCVIYTQLAFMISIFLISKLCLFVPTVKKNNKMYLCSGCFFPQTSFDFLTSHFWRIFFSFHHSKYIFVLSLNLKRHFTFG